MAQSARIKRAIREFGTPLTIGAFIIMGTTGGLMFFHAAMPLNGVLHRWTGLVMITAVSLHAIANWPSVERYFKKSVLARSIIGLGAIILVASFVNWWGYSGQSEGNVYEAVMRAPASRVASLTGQTFDVLKAKLSAIDVQVGRPSETLDQATNGDKSLQEKVVIALFPPAS